MMNGLRVLRVGWIALVCAAWGSLPAASAPQQPLPGSAIPFSSAQARAVLDRYCVTCHNTRLKTAGLVHGAILRESVPIVRFLVDKGARLDARNQLGWTPLSVAMGLYTGGTFRQYPETSEVLRELMQHRGLDFSTTIVCSSCGRDEAGPTASSAK